MTVRDIAVAFGFEVDKSSEKQAENSIKGLKNMATKLLGGIAVVFSVSKLASFTKDCIQAASDVEQMENKFDVVFGEISKDVDKWAKDFADAVGRNKNEIKSYLADQQNLLVGFGMTREAGAKMSEEMTSLALDIASFANLDEATAVHAMSKALMGESESAKTLGAVLNDSTREAAMLEMGLKGDFNSLDQLTKMQVNYQAIMMQSKDAIGDCVRSLDSYESRQRQLSSAVAEFKEFVGGQLMPVMAVFVGWITEAVKGATAFSRAILLDADGNNRLLRTFERIHAVVKRLQPAIDRMMQTLSNGAKKGIDFIKGIVDKLGGIENALKLLVLVAGAFVLAMNWQKILSGAKSFVTMIKGIGKLFSTANLHILAVVAVIVVLALIVEDFVNFLLGNESVIGTIFDEAGIGADNARKSIFAAWEKIKQFLFAAWDTIRQGAGMFIDTVRGFFERHGDSIRKNFERAWGIIKTFLQGTWTFISQLAATLFGQTEKNVDGSTKSTQKSILDIWQTILSTLSSVWDALYEVASAVFNAVATVIETVFGWIQSFWNAWGSKILSWFKVVWDSMGGVLGGFLDIIKGVANFISAVFSGDWQGAWSAIKDIFIGIWEVITNYLSAAWETIKLVFTMALSALKSVWETIWNGIKAFFEGTWNGISSFVTGIFSNIISGVTNSVKKIKDTIVNGLTTAINWIKSLPSQALKWGSDIIEGIVNGIKGAIGKVEEAAKGVADKIKSFLHFSVPDEGPLTDYQNWMPDFMGGLAKGIGENKGAVLDKVRELANGIASLTQAAVATPATATTSTVNNSTSSVVQNNNFNNSFTGGSAETQKNVSKAMKKSAYDATSYMAKGLSYARG